MTTSRFVRRSSKRSVPTREHHLWVLWTDYFKVEHLKEYPNLHDLFWMATKSAGETKKTNDVAVADRLLSEIDAIAEIFWATKK